MDKQISIPKIIWMYWEQGFEDAHVVVKNCVRSWQKYNSNWDLRLLDKMNFSEYVCLDLPEEKISTLSLAQKSDLIRLKLLEKYGGVWADATTYCFKPLDEWIEEASVSGFFAFDRPGPGRLLASWFLISEKHNILVVQWCQLLTDYWNMNKFPQPGKVRKEIVERLGYHLNGSCKRTKYWFSPFITKIIKVYPYFAIHYLFERLISNDEEGRIIWEKTKKISADGPHSLQFEGLLSPLTEANKKLVDESDVPMFKLTYKNFEAEKYPFSLLWYLFEGRYGGEGNRLKNESDDA
ncbi:capsular polysaccharide synthesis protein [Thiomicrolovo sp. ZZH C-3]